MQNLLPLALRPLRLVLPPEQLRSARIVLLKATHWPFVLLILAYERGRLWLADRRRTGSSSVSNRLSHNSAASLRRPLTRRTLSGVAPLLDDQPRSGRSSAEVPATAPTAAPETIEGLGAAVANLRTQVEVLTDLLSQHKAAQDVA